MKNNLAYDRDYRTRSSYEYEPEEIHKITNIRTAGGVMFKAGSSKKSKLNTNRAKSRNPKTNINRGTVLSVIIISAMAFLVLFRGLMITSGYEKLEERNALLSETVAENQKIQFKIDQMLDLKNIETIAKNTFNMGAPSKSQTIYINLDQTDEVKKVKGDNSFFDSVKNFFGGIVEYFS